MAGRSRWEALGAKAPGPRVPETLGTPWGGQKSKGPGISHLRVAPCRSHTPSGPVSHLPRVWKSSPSHSPGSSRENSMSGHLSRPHQAVSRVGLSGDGGHSAGPPGWARHPALTQSPPEAAQSAIPSPPISWVSPERWNSRTPETTALWVNWGHRATRDQPPLLSLPCGLFKTQALADPAGPRFLGNRHNPRPAPCPR